MRHSHGIKGQVRTMMTLEEAIEQYANTAVFCKMHESEKYAAEFKQLAAWLRELVERRKAPEIITCGECKHRDPEDKKCDCGHDIIWQLPRDDDWYCADADRRTDEMQ